MADLQKLLNEFDELKDYVSFVNNIIIRKDGQVRVLDWTKTKYMKYKGDLNGTKI